MSKKCAEYDESMTHLQEQMAGLKQANSEIVADLRKQLSEVTEKLAKGTVELQVKDETIMKIQ